MPLVGDFTSWFEGGANAGAFSDIKVTFGLEAEERTLNLHKIVLCNDNGWFARSIGPKSAFSEAGKAAITLKDDDAKAMTVVLRWVYRPTSLTLTDAVPKTGSLIQTYLNIYNTADKYDVRNLCTEISKRITNLVSSAQGDDQEIVNILFAIYNLDVTGAFKNKLQELIRDNIEMLWKIDEVKEAIKADKELSWDFIEAFAKTKVTEKKIKDSQVADDGGTPYGSYSNFGSYTDPGSAFGGGNPLYGGGRVLW